MMRMGSLFSGIGGLELGLEWSGIGHTVWQVEKDAFCRRKLAWRWPDAQRFEDVRDVGAANLAAVDLICGGFPCQDVSSAGKRAGLAGARSGLWTEFARVVAELRPRSAQPSADADGERCDAGTELKTIRSHKIASRHTADTDHDTRRVHVQSRQDVSHAQRHGGWTAEPAVARVVYGLPGRVDYERALGNSVVPQCAEVVGHVIRQLLEAP